MEKRYDFVIVGAGFAGASCARLLTNKGYKCLIIEERPFVSGNCIDIKQNNINIHCLGPHIIHTNDEEVWQFLNSNGEIRKFYPNGKTYYDGKLISFPPNLQTVYDIHGDIFVDEAIKYIDKCKVKHETISNIEEYCLSNFGQDIYEQLFANFIKKMFNKDPKELSLDNFEYKELLRKEYNSKLYSEKYQGIPASGYKEYIEGMIGEDIDILLNTSFHKDKEKFISLAKYVIYTGEIDKFFNYCLGSLEWVSVNFDLEDCSEKTTNMLGMPILNFSCKTTNWYRITEHKWLDPDNAKHIDNTIITTEYFVDWNKGMESYYPILTTKSLMTYERYVKKLNALYPNVLLCGRKASYNFAHIADVVRQAIDLTDKFEDKI